MPQTTDRRSIADHSRDVNRSLSNLLVETRTTETTLAGETVEDILDRFKLWAGNLGALHEPHKRMSLESRLADHPDLQNMISEQLQNIQEAIQDCQPPPPVSGLFTSLISFQC